MNEQQQTPAPAGMSNIGKATAVGAGAGGVGAYAVYWLASEGERRYGVPAAVSAPLLGSAFAFVARWAAKLLPDG